MTDGVPFCVADQEMSKSRTSTGCNRRTVGVGTVALLVATVVGARLMAVAVTAPGHGWIGVVALVPLFAAIRLLSPARALLCGAFWGASVFAFGVSMNGAGIVSGWQALTILTLSPALYTFGGAWLTRRIGFSPFVLAVAWMFVEWALASSTGGRTGLLAGAQGDGWLVHTVGRLFGYLLVAFLVAYAGARLVTALSEVRFPVPSGRTLRAAREYIEHLTSQTFFCYPLFAIRASAPRGPPATE